MSNRSTSKTDGRDRAIDSALVWCWTDARNVMLTDNSALDPQDPLCCMDLLVHSWQTENVQRCIKTLYQGLRWASLLNIKGGYAGQRRYEGLFLIDDPHIIGVFDDRSKSRGDVESDCRPPSTLEELIYLYNCGKGNIKTLVVFEKPNLRLANSDEKARQSYFVAETIYPALFAITQVLSQLESLQLSGHSDSYSSDNDSESYLAKTSEDINKRFLGLSPLFINLFDKPGQVNKLLLQKSPLHFFCSTNSPLNLSIDDDLSPESMPQFVDLMETNSL